VTALLFEEIFGRQDTLHLMIHLRELGDYRRVSELERTDAGMRSLLAQQRVPDALGGGAWGQLFVPGSLHDTVLAPMDAGV
jgi:hypothetical protein